MDMLGQLASKYPDKFELLDNMSLFSKHCTMKIGYSLYGCNSACGYSIKLIAYGDIEKRHPRLVDYDGIMYVDFNYDYDDRVIEVTSFDELEKIALGYEETILRIRKRLMKEQRIKMIREL